MKKFFDQYRWLLGILLLAFLLRVVALGSYPIGLYSDEAAFGYNAYLLLKTGRDEYGRFWPMAFQSFEDWKPPMQGWLAVPLVAWLGLNEVAVRLPSALLGTATVAVVYYLAEEFFRQKLKNKFSIPLIASLLLAVNPWHIFMSRVAMLVAVEGFFVSLGVLGLLKGVKSSTSSESSTSSRWLIVSAASFSGAIYSYYGSRVTVPLLLMVLVAFYLQEIMINKKYLILPILVGGGLLMPLFISAIKNPLVLVGRAQTTSVFFNDSIRGQLWEAHTIDGLAGISPLWSRFFHNKWYYYTRDIASRWWSHFSPQFLFFEGDSHPPFQIPGLGYLHLVDLPFFAIGLLSLIGRIRLMRDKKAAILLLYLLATPVVAGLTFMTPAANRSFNLVIPWTLITAYGLVSFFQLVKIRQIRVIGGIGVTGGYLISLGLFGYTYVKLIPQQLPHHWYYGRGELVAKLEPLLPKYNRIYLTNKGGPPYIFLSFCLKIPPEEFQRTIKRHPVINELGWGHVNSILDITIPREFSWAEVPKEKDALYVGFEDEIPEDEVKVLERVYYPNGQSVYTLAILK